jgi:methylthioribose-1-phosphate isomerase
MTQEKTLQAIKYKRGELQILDQLLLPYQTNYELVKDSNDGHKVIKSMKVRGAPAIAIVAALSLAVELHSKMFDDNKTALEFIKARLEYLKTSRPTAVNLFEASARLLTLVESNNALSGQELCTIFVNGAEEMLAKDLLDNKGYLVLLMIAIGANGAKFILENIARDGPVNVLTHCNTGSLATSGHGILTLIV